MKKILSLIIITLSVILTACGTKDYFTVTATVEGLGTQNVKIFYRSGETLVALSSTALDGKFTFTGNAPHLTLVEIYTASRSLIGAFAAKNGDDIKVELKLNEPGFIKIKGDKTAEKMAQFITDHASIINNDSRDSINMAVEGFIRANVDEPASAMLLVTFFDAFENPSMADSLASMLSPKALPTDQFLKSFRSTLHLSSDTLTTLPSLRLFTLGDSLTTINRQGKRRVLLAITGQEQSDRDEMTASLTALADSLKNSIEVVELSLVNDTTEWHSMLGDKKPRYRACWMPGGTGNPVLAPLAIPSMPWYIATDSTSRIVYRGRSLDHAIKTLEPV